MDSARAVVRSLGDSRGIEAIGRHARLELRFERRNGRTVLADSYAEPPFRVGACFEERDGLHLIMASCAPGIFGGDCLNQRIDVGPGARVRLTSQSAIQVHASRDGDAARLSSVYHVAGDGELRCQWDPLIPFADARLEQQIAVHLSPDARLEWSDALMSGREARGERWRFLSIEHELRVSRRGRLEYLERYGIAPADGRVVGPWVAGGASYFGTTLLSGWEHEAEEIDARHRRLVAVEGIQAAADLLDRRLLLVRLATSSGRAFREARGTV